MELTHIITLANCNVRLRFLAMERSLRATGCDLPVRVIPYDDNRFDLPANAEWWEIPEMTIWLGRWGAHPTMRKYQCLLTPGFQFVDADVCFLRDPASVLRPLSGFVTSCGHWHNPGHTVTAESRAFMAARSTIWQSRIFNTGQWACDRMLFSLEELIRRAEATRLRSHVPHVPLARTAWRQPARELDGHLSHERYTTALQYAVHMGG